MKKYIWQILLFIVLAVILFSCSVSHLHKSGTYRIKSLRADTATFYRLEGNYLMDTKNLKIGQKIYLKRVYDSTLATVIRIK